MKAGRIGIIVIVFIMLFTVFVFAEEGTYDAITTTETGSTSAMVNEESGNIIDIQPSGGQDSSIYGVNTGNFGETTGIDSKGESVTIYNPNDYQPEEPIEPNEEEALGSYPAETN